MKKNIFKILLVVVILIIGILLQDKAIEYATLIKISSTTKTITEGNKNVQVRVTEKYNNGAEKITETYIKDGVFVTRKIDGKNAPSNSLTWSTTNKDVICNYYYEYEFEYNDEVVKGLDCVYNHEDISSNQSATRLAMGNLLLMYDKDVPYSSGYMNVNIINMPKIENSEYNGIACLALKTEYKTWFVERETLRTIAIECKAFEDDSPYLYTFEYDIEAPEGIYEEPNTSASYYDKVEFYEVAYLENGAARNSEKENAISGTDLKPGEELIENVELKEGEELNFLKLTENNFGLQGFNIYTLTTYNKFREKYSGLRELTEADFNEYYVGIVYKEGYKLNHIQNLIATKAGDMYSIFATEKNAKDSLVLIIAPKTKDSAEIKFVLNDEKVNITEDTAMKTVSENIKELNSELVLDSENYVNIELSEITILDNKTFAELDVIKTPVKGKEPICWKLTVVDGELKRLDAYVNIMTGELIGSKNR